VVLLTRREEVATAVNRQHRNPSHLTAFELPDNLTACTDDVAALAGATCIIHCIPVQQSAQFLAARAHLIPPSLPIVCTSKGLNSDTLETMHGAITSAVLRPDSIRTASSLCTHASRPRLPSPQSVTSS
jgi:glycerol-3-phosphate dehydrogenase